MTSNMIRFKPPMLIIPERQQSQPVPKNDFDNNASFIIKINNSNIYLGAIEHSINKELHKQLKITSIVCVYPEIPYLNNDPEYTILHIPILDSGKNKISDFFKPFEEFMDKQILEEKNILVHCHMGISRSSTLLISYLMKKQKKNLVDTLKFVKDKRPQVDPNFWFHSALIKYESELNENT